MNRPILKWVFPSCLVATLSLFSLDVMAQQNIVPIDAITPNPDLHADSIIPLPTIEMRGHDILPSGMASPFSGTDSNKDAVEPGSLRFPGQLSFHGGPTIDYAQNHSVFLNPTAACAANTCWGDPIGFLGDLGQSHFIHVADQYVNDGASGRYTVGTNFAVQGYSPSAGAGKPFTNQDMAIAAYSLAAQTGGFGYNHIYHLFLVPGQDVCFDSTFTTCYSPDNLKTFAFCAYHGSAHDGAGNVVLYSVEPYQNVGGCDVGPGTPNGQLADSTNNVLSHETFETITDPRGNAWWNSLNTGMYGEEIGDECAFVTANGAYWNPSLVRLNHKEYATQPEYSNSQNACSTNHD